DGRRGGVVAGHCGDDEPALAADRHRNGRPGNVHVAGRIRAGLSRYCADGGRRHDKTPQSHWSAAAHRGGGRHLGSPVGKTWGDQNDSPHVVSAAPLLSRPKTPLGWHDRMGMAPGNPDKVAIAILAKAPLPGFAKTRLASVLGMNGAANLQARFIEHTVATAQSAAVGPVTLWVAPDHRHPAFQ